MQIKTPLLLIITTLASLTLVVRVFAASNGPYIGISLGYGNTHQEDDSGKVSNNGFAGLATMGFQFDRYLAIQSDLLKLNETSDNFSRPPNTYGRATIYSCAIDLVGKGIVPLPYHFSLFGTLGVAYLSEQGRTYPNGLPDSNITETKVLPTFGAGISYDITPHLSTELTWSHIQKIGSNNDLANTDFVGLGLTYHINELTFKD